MTTRSDQGRVANRPCATSSPATSPGTATEPGPTWKSCVPASSKSTTTSSISPKRPAGTEKKQSRRVVSPCGSCTSRKPPPAGPVSGPSATNAAKSAARSASTAFPPASSTSAPARVLNGWPAAIAPFIRGAYFRLGGTVPGGDVRRPGSVRRDVRRAPRSQLVRRKVGSSVSELAARRLAGAELGRRRPAPHPAETGCDHRHPDLPG